MQNEVRDIFSPPAVKATDLTIAQIEPREKVKPSEFRQGDDKSFCRPGR